MFVLTVTSPRSHQHPSIWFQHADDVPDLHRPKLCSASICVNSRHFAVAGGRAKRMNMRVTEHSAAIFNVHRSAGHRRRFDGQKPRRLHAEQHITGCVSEKTERRETPPAYRIGADMNEL